MELKLMYLILTGWAVMLLVPSILPAFIIAAVFGGAAVYVGFLEQAGNGDLWHLTLRLSPVVTIAIFAAWPLGAFFRWMLRRRPGMY